MWGSWPSGTSPLSPGSAPAKLRTIIFEACITELECLDNRVYGLSISTFAIHSIQVKKFRWENEKSLNLENWKIEPNEVFVVTVPARD